MQKLLFLVSLYFLVFTGDELFAQNGDSSLYNPNANAREELKTAIRNAEASDRHVLVQIGGNW